MPVNNTPDFSPHFPNSSHSPDLKCFKLKTSIYILSAFVVIHILLILPVFVYVLYLGFQRRRRQCSTSTDTSSPSDLFTYHSIIMQLSEFMGFIMLSLGGIYDVREVETVGSTILNFTFLAKALFHLLTCVERYLAVVHPIAYLRLKQASGVRITNIIIGCVWIISFLTLAILFEGSSRFSFFVFVSFMSSVLAAIAFCSISVLCALKRPGPGEANGNRGRVDQSKQRAFYTIMGIMGLLVLRFGGGLVANVLLDMSLWNNECIRFMIIVWLDLPSVLVLPLLFLHRAGKLHHCGL